MNFYLASRTQHKQAIVLIGKLLVALGHEIVSTWHTEDSKIKRAQQTDHYSMDDPLVNQAVVRALAEIEKTDVLLVYTVGSELSAGGLFFEAGYALGKGKQVYVFGPHVNIFCTLFTGALLRAIGLEEDRSQATRAPERKRTHPQVGKGCMKDIVARLQGILRIDDADTQTYELTLFLRSLEETIPKEEIPHE